VWFYFVTHTHRKALEEVSYKPMWLQRGYYVFRCNTRQAFLLQIKDEIGKTGLQQVRNI